MSEPTKTIPVEVLEQYSEDDAASLGKLLTHLSSRFDGKPIEKSRLLRIIESSSHDTLVARTQDTSIVGTATLSIILGASGSSAAYLEDFVVAPEFRSTGLADEIWDKIIQWCNTHDVEVLKFTSKPERAAAHRFYLKHGATIRDTSSFSKTIS